MKRIIAVALLALMLIGLAACAKTETKEYKFDVCGTLLSPGDSAKQVLEEQKYAKSESSASCGGFEGLDYKLFYNGYTVSTTPAKEGDVISQIVITSDSVSTPEGITIGSTAEQVISAYGDYHQKSEENLRYESGDVTLSFIINDGKVASIQYGRK